MSTAGNLARHGLAEILDAALAGEPFEPPAPTGEPVAQVSRSQTGRA